MSLFDQNQLIVKEKAFKIFNHFEIYDKSNTVIGQATEAKNWLKKLTGRFQLDFYEHNRRVLRIKKPFSIIKPRAYVYGADNQLLGYFVKKVIALRPRFYVFNAQKQQIGMLEGDIIGWNFELIDSNRQPVLVVNKKFAGFAREVFTTADAYNLFFHENKNIPKQVALATPFVVDMLIHEHKKRGMHIHTY